MAYGKTIKLFWVDGNYDGIITAELSNWDGKGIKIPRIDVKKSQRDDITLPGVYFLLCEDESIYIGEAENVQDRLITHINNYNSGKESYYWTAAIMFVGKSLNKALIRYLENKIYEDAKSCNSYKILTLNTYKKTVLEESDIAYMDEFLENSKILLKALGYNILEGANKQELNKTYYYCKGNNANAKGYVSENGFTVLKDSIVSDHITPSFKTNVLSWYKLRLQLFEDGTIKGNVLQKDYEFSTPSAASAIMLGRPSNGNNDWKTSDGEKLKERKQKITIPLS